jgi:hypothetical protein
MRKFQASLLKKMTVIRSSCSVLKLVSNGAFECTQRSRSREEQTPVFRENALPKRAMGRDKKSKFAKQGSGLAFSFCAPCFR